MKRLLLALVAAVLAVPLSAQQVPPRATAFTTAPDIPYESVPNFLKMPPNIYLGEGIGVARNSKGHIFIFTRRGDTRLFEFDQGVWIGPRDGLPKRDRTLRGRDHQLACAEADAEEVAMRPRMLTLFVCTAAAIVPSTIR